MLTFLRKLKKKYARHSPLIEITIRRDAIVHNLEEFRRLCPTLEIAPVLKSNAYGHGLPLIANIIEKENVPFIVVDSHFEARALRHGSIKKPLLIIGYSTISTILSNTLKNISFGIMNIAVLRALRDEARSRTAIHLKIDTGMHRQGILPEELDEALSCIASNPHILLDGVLSHLADADSADPTFTEQQISLWNSCVKKIKAWAAAHGKRVRYFHVSATAGHTYAQKIDANVSRLGIGLYGIDHAARLMPALQMKTIVSGVKQIKKGATVGYGRTYTAPRDMTIATIPVGYFEGLDRRLSNKGVVKIEENGTAFFAQIVGQISMNISVIDVTDVPGVAIDDDVVVISAHAMDPNSVENMAKMCATIPYEILVKIPEHLYRVGI
jgi:alanine racemase